ncbi:MAG: uroporphyrinogen-III synthase [Acidimicrobiia bacterium]|nr:uroporphyrinogen-III synthase [Acidimicrobiia bacterium]
MTLNTSRLVLVTRHETAAGPLSSALRAVGLEPVVAPGFTYEPAEVALDTPEWRRYAWVTWTSAAAVEAVLGVGELRTPLDTGANVRHAAVGGATADALRVAGIEPEVVGEGGAADLAELLLGRLHTSDRLLYPKSDRADASFAERLRSFGVEVDDPVAYRIGPADPERIRVALTRRPGTVTFASPSAVSGFADALVSGDDERQEDATTLLPDLVLASIGPTTSAALRNRLREPDVTAETPSFADLAAAVMTRLEQAGVHEPGGPV